MRRLSRSHTTSGSSGTTSSTSNSSQIPRLEYSTNKNSPKINTTKKSGPSSGPSTPQCTSPCSSSNNQQSFSLPAGRRNMANRRLSLQPLSSSSLAGLRLTKLSPNLPFSTGNSGSTTLEKGVPVSATVAGKNTTSTTTVKIMVVGGSKVGKTTVISSFLRVSPPPKYHKTVEEMHLSEHKILGNEKLVLEILDTAGSFEFPAMRNLNILNSDAFLIVWGGERVVDEDGDPGTTEALSLLDQILTTKGPDSRIVLLHNEFGGHQGHQGQAGGSDLMTRVPSSVIRLSANCYHNVDSVFTSLLVKGGWIGTGVDLGKTRVSGGGGGGGRRTSLPSASNNTSSSGSGVEKGVGITGSNSANSGTAGDTDNRNSCRVS